MTLVVGPAALVREITIAAAVHHRLPSLRRRERHRQTTKELSHTMPFGIGLPEVIIMLVILLVIFGLVVAALRLGIRR